jgi:hypothetical protein
MKTITEDEWIEQYKPVPNPVAENGYDFGEGSTLIQGYGHAENDLLEKAGANRIWTVLECDETQVIASGRHIVNATGYIITEIAYNEDMEVTLDI